MHVLIVFVKLCSVGFGGETGQAFFVDIHPQRFVACHHDINSQIELVSIYQKRISHVSRNDTEIINIQVVNIVYDMDSPSSGRVARFHDPDVSSRVGLLEPLVVSQKVTILVRQDVSVRVEVEVLSAKLFLHFDVVKAHPVLPGDLVRMWKMVQPLVLIQPLVKVSLAAATCPQDIPLMRLGESKSIKLTHGSDKFGVSLEDLVEKLAVVNMVSTSRSSSVPTIGTCRRCIHQKLRFINHFEIDSLIHTILIFSFLGVLVQWK